jgi:hypothetical protein
MSLSLPDIVPLSGGGQARRERRGLLSDPFTRRQFIRTAFAVGTTAAITVLGWLPPMRLRRAVAGHCPYTENLVCHDIQYSDSDGCCQTCGETDVDPNYCGCTNDTWHRHDQQPLGGGDYIEYNLRPHSCEDRNAWRWKVRNCVGGRVNKIYRCSDGKRKTCRPPNPCSAWLNTSCPKLLDNGDPC